MIIILSNDPNLISRAYILGSKYHEKVVHMAPGCFSELKPGERVTFVAHGHKKTLGDEELSPAVLLARLEAYKFPFGQVTQFDFPNCEVGYIHPDRSSYVRSLSEEMERKGYPHQLKSFTTWVTPQKIANIILTYQVTGDTYTRGIPQSAASAYLAELTDLAVRSEKEKEALIKFNNALTIFQNFIAHNESNIEKIREANTLLYEALDSVGETDFPHLSAAHFKELLNAMLNAGQKILQQRSHPVVQKEWIIALKRICIAPFLLECQRVLERFSQPRADYLNTKYGIALSIAGDARETLDSNLNYLFSPDVHRVIHAMDDARLLVWREINNQISDLWLQKPPLSDRDLRIKRLEAIRKEAEEGKIDLSVCLARLVEGSSPLFNVKRVGLFKHLQVHGFKESSLVAWESKEEKAELPNKNVLLARAAQAGLLLEVAKLWMHATNRQEVAYYAVLNENVSLLDFLGEKKFDFSQPCGAEALPALCHAVKASNWKIVLHLLALKANPGDVYEAKEAGVTFKLDQVNGFEVCVAAHNRYDALSAALESIITGDNKLLMAELMYHVMQQYHDDPIQFGKKGFVVNSLPLLQLVVSASPPIAPVLAEAQMNVSAMLSFAVKQGQWDAVEGLLSAGVMPELKPEEPIALFAKERLDNLIRSQKMYRSLVSSLDEMKTTSTVEHQSVVEVKAILQELYRSYQHLFFDCVESEQRLFRYLSQQPRLLEIFRSQGILFETPIYKAIKQKKWLQVEKLLNNNLPYPPGLSDKLSADEYNRLAAIKDSLQIRNKIFVALDAMKLSPDQEWIRSELKNHINQQFSEDRHFFVTAGFNVVSPAIMILLAKDPRFVSVLITAGVDFTLEMAGNETPIQLAAEQDWGLVVQILQHLPDKMTLCDHDKAFLSAHRLEINEYLHSRQSKLRLFGEMPLELSQLLPWESLAAQSDFKKTLG